MSLHELQCALAELFTSVEARERYDADCVAFCLTHRLDERERAQLAALARSAIASYAAGLVRKRRAEVARLLPDVCAAQGSAFAATFDGWAARTPLGEGPDRYARDADAFKRWSTSNRLG
jgi:hypothetical protein